MLCLEHFLEQLAEPVLRRLVPGDLVEGSRLRHGTNVALYDLVCASRKLLAIDFFREAVGVTPTGQRAFDFG